MPQDLQRATTELPAYTTGRPIAMPPGPGTSTGPRQPPTPPPSGVVEPPEPLSDQAKVKFWRDRALQADPAAEPGNLGPELEGQGCC